MLGHQLCNQQQWIHVITRLLSHFVDSCQMYLYAKWLDGKREKKCVSCCLWSCLTLKAKISASSNVTGSASDFTNYSLFVSHANRPERDRVKYWDSRRIRTPSPVSSCYESLESTKIHTMACQWIQFWASCTHFQHSKTSCQFILLYSNVTFSVFQLTAFYNVTPHKFCMCF